MSLPRSFSLNELAEAAGVNPKTIRRRIADGSLPAYRLGGRAIRIREADALKFLGGPDAQAVA